MTTAAALRVQHVLTTAEWDPPGAPPASILIVRQLSDPAPRRLLNDGNSLAASRVWKQALRERLEQLYRGARRPAWEPVHDANAVLFADQAELLACLAADLVSGRAWGAWWWRSFVLRWTVISSAAAVPELFGEQPQNAPGTMAALVRLGMLTAVLKLLPPAVCLELVRNVAQLFELPYVAHAASQEAAVEPAYLRGGAVGPVAVEGLIERESDRGAVTRSLPPDAVSPSRRAATRPVPAPWLDIAALDVQEEGLAPEQALVGGLCLLLHRAPLLARRRGFAGAIERWLSDARGRHANRAPAEPEPSSALRSSARSAAAVRAEAVSETPGVIPATGLDQPPERTEELLASQAEHRSPAEAAPGLPPAGPEPEQSTPSVGRARPAPASPKEAATPSNPAGPSPEPVAASAQAAEDRFETEVGGVLFLIHILRRLELFEECERLCDAERPMGGWELLELMGRELLESRYHDDPLWRWMAVLEDREPGTRHPDYACVAAELVPRAGALLRSLLRVNDEDALGAAMLECRGVVYSTSTHVDLVMALAAARIEVRLTGLDANPGWVPMLGRVVTFHFREAVC